MIRVMRCNVLFRGEWLSGDFVRLDDGTAVCMMPTVARPEHIIPLEDQRVVFPGLLSTGEAMRRVGDSRLAWLTPVYDGWFDPNEVAALERLDGR